MTDTPGSSSLTADERAAARAFVARCEVRLSTFHRIAVGMLSGAGLLVVLPVVAHDSITGILRSLFSGDIGVVEIALIIAIGAMLAVPAVALWLLFADLTRFYFHANHIGSDGDETFTPRFTLTSLQLPSDELGPAATAELVRTREDPRIVELLVPANDESRGASIGSSMCTAASGPDMTMPLAQPACSSSPLPEAGRCSRRWPRWNTAWLATCSASAASCSATSRRCSRC